MCPSPRRLTNPVLPAVGSPWDVGSTKALPALHRLQLRPVLGFPSFVLLGAAHKARTEERD